MLQRNDSISLTSAKAKVENIHFMYIRKLYGKSIPKEILWIILDYAYSPFHERGPTLQLSMSELSIESLSH